MPLLSTFLKEIKVLLIGTLETIFNCFIMILLDQAGYTMKNPKKENRTRHVLGVFIECYINIK